MAWPLWSRPTSVALGFWTLSTTSDVAYRSSVETTVAPASANAWSGMAEPAPAPASTRTSSPAAVSLPSTSGTRATRRSPAAVSLATPTFMGITNSRKWGWTARSVPEPQRPATLRSGSDGRRRPAGRRPCRGIS